MLGTMTPARYRSIRRWQAPRERTLAKVKSRRVYLFVSKETWIEADLYDEMYRASNGKVPAELVIACPRCDGALRINGAKFHIEIHYLDKPRQLTMPDGEVVEQTAVVSVEGTRKCSHPAVTGKGMCGREFTIRENRVY